MLQEFDAPEKKVAPQPEARYGSYFRMLEILMRLQLNRITQLLIPNLNYSGHVDPQIRIVGTPSDVAASFGAQH